MVNVFLNIILIGFSETAVSVLGVYFRIQSFVFMPVFGLNQGSTPIMGYNYGAKNKERLLKTPVSYTHLPSSSASAASAGECTEAPIV